MREARDGDRLERGVALIASGGRHLQLRKAGGQCFAKVLNGLPVNRHGPSVARVMPVGQVARAIQAVDSRGGGSACIGARLHCS